MQEVQVTNSRASKRQLPLLTASSMRTFQRCPREYYWRYEQGLQPVGERAETLRFGTLVHKALEAWWGVAKPLDVESEEDPRLVAALDALREHQMTVDPYQFEVAWAMMVAYHHRWGNESLEAMAVELEFRADLVNPATRAPSRTWQHGGKLDVVARETTTGRTMLVEHKTSSEDIGPGSEYWRRLQLDAQVSLYFTGAKAHGMNLDGCVYDVLGKPKLRPYKATPPEERKYTKGGALYASQREEDETPKEFGARVMRAIAENPDRYFQRGEVVRLEDDQFEFGFDAWAIGREVRERQLSGLWARNPDSCSRYGRTCDYFDICTGAARAEDTSRFTQLPWPHSELTPPELEAPCAEPEGEGLTSFESAEA